MVPLDDAADPADAAEPAWYGNLELWRRGLDQATRPDLRRVVVSHLDPPLARRISGEMPALDIIPGPTGPTGTNGATGPTGTNGTNGANGSTGAHGTDGATGINGRGGRPSRVLPTTPMLSMTRRATSTPTWSTTDGGLETSDPPASTSTSGPTSGSVPAVNGDTEGLWPTGLVRHPERSRATRAVELAARRTRARLVRLGWTLGLVLALAFGWFVLVAVRAPGSDDAPVDEIGIRIHETLVDTQLADRMLSFTGWVATVSTTLVLGGVIFRVFVMGPLADPARTASAADLGRKVLHRVAVAGIAAELLSLALRAAAMSDTGFAAAWNFDILRFVLTGRFGDAALVRIAGLALLAGFLPVLPIGPASRRPDARGRQRSHLLERAGCLAGALVVLVSFAIVGHPQASAPAAVLVPIQWVHIVAVSTWFGGVAFLGIELHQQKREGSAHGFAEVVRRFSAVATVTILLAGMTGLVMAYSQLNSVGALRSTAYGRALTAKVAVLAVPLAIGGYNRQRIVPAIVRRDEPSAWRHLRRTLALETLFIALGVLLATAAMTSGGFQ